MTAKPRRKTSQAPKGRKKTAQGNALGNAPPEDQSPEPERSGDRSPTSDRAAVNEVNQRATHLRDGWRLLPLGKLGHWFGGGTPSKANPAFWTNGTIPWVSPKDMKTDRIRDAQDHITSEAVANSATSLVPAGSVLLVVRSGILKHTLPVAVTEREVSLNQDLKAVTPSADILPEYLALGLKAFEREILHRCCKSGTTVQNLEMPVFLRFELPVAPPDDQRRIVAEIEKQFTRLEAGVAALRRVQANLKRYRAAVLKAACEGRLVPTEAELCGSGGPPLNPDSTAKSTPSKAGSKVAARQKRRDAASTSTFESGQQLLARILTERRQNWQGRGKYKEPSSLSASGYEPDAPPEGWAWATVDQLAAPEPNSITDGPFGSNLKTEHYTSSGPRVVRLQNIGDGVYVDEEAHITQERYERLKKHRIFANDVVIAGFGENPPRCCVIPGSLGPAIVKADCIRFKPHSDVLSKCMNAALNSDPVRKRTKGMVHGVGRPRLNLGEIKSIGLPLPPLAEQTRIVAEVERRLSVVEELEAMVTTNLQRATRLRQAVLQKAFTGEL